MPEEQAKLSLCKLGSGTVSQIRLPSFLRSSAFFVVFISPVVLVLITDPVQLSRMTPRDAAKKWKIPFCLVNFQTFLDFAENFRL